MPTTRDLLYVCPYPGCKRNGDGKQEDSWTRKDNFKDHLQRLHLRNDSGHTDEEREAVVQKSVTAPVL